MTHTTGPRDARSGASARDPAVRMARILAMVASLHPSLGAGQSATIIPEAASCATCRITTVRQVVLDETEAYPILTVPIVVRTDQRDRIWVLLPDALPALYSNEGRFVRLVGRKGRGPGEFAIPYEIFPAGADSIVVLDAGTRRATVFDLDLRPTRYMRVPWGLRPVLAQQWPRRAVAAALVRTPAASGFPLHTVRFDGAEIGISASFGRSGEALPPDGYEITYLPFPSRSPERFWTAERDRYRLTEWSAEGRALRTLARAPDWFRSPVSLGIGTPTTPPPPSIVDAQEDDDGLLWVVVHRPKRTWQRAWPATRGSDHVLANDVRYDQLYDTVIEVIDPRGPSVVARRTMPDHLVALLRGRRAVAYRTTDDGDRTISILTLVLEGRASRVTR